MPLQSSGAISFANIQSEFGGVNPIGINEYYLNGSSGYVSGSGATGIPTSGQISINQFYGKSKVVIVPAPVETFFYNSTYYHPSYIYLGSVSDFITGSSGTNLSRTGVSTFNIIGLYTLSNKPSNLIFFPSLILQARAGDTIQIKVGWAMGPFRSGAYIYLYLNFGYGYIYANNYAIPTNSMFMTIYGTATFNYPISSNISPGNYAILCFISSGSGNNAYYYSLHLY
jgi:hypothetical protein